MARIMPTSRTCLDILVLVFSAALIYSWIILGGKDVEQRVVDKENIVLYGCTNYRSKNHEVSLLWNDLDLKINWGVKKPILSSKDNNAITLKRFLINK